MTDGHIRTSPGLQRGLSLVEVLVGLAVSLIVTAAAISLIAGQLHGNRRLLLEAQLTHDLRMTAHLVVTHLRRAGHWAAVEESLHGGPGMNPHIVVMPEDEPSPLLSFRYGGMTSTAAYERFAFRNHQGVLQMRLGENGGWQSLTDPANTRIIDFVIEPSTTRVTLEDFCTSSCSDHKAGCIPEQLVREFSVSIRAMSTSDHSIERSTVTRVRLRADAIHQHCT